MIGITILVMSSVSAILGVLHTHKARENGHWFRDLTRLGSILILIAIVGMTVGVVKEVKTLRQGRDAEMRNEETLRRVKEIEVYVRSLQRAESDPRAAERLSDVSKRLSSLSGGNQFLLVSFEGGEREVMLDGIAAGMTNHLISTAPGIYEIGLGGAKDFVPPHQSLQIDGTSAVAPLKVRFAPKRAISTR